MSDRLDQFIVHFVEPKKKISSALVQRIVGIDGEFFYMIIDFA